VQWNGIRLRGLTFEEVYDIIFESKFDPQVELTVYRPVGNTQQRRNDPECLTNTEGIWRLNSTISVSWHQFVIYLKNLTPVNSLLVKKESYNY